MRIDPAGRPFIGAAAAATVLGGVLRQPALLVPGAALTAFFTYFFRDPDRRVSAGVGEVVSPADGRVLVAGPAEPTSAPPGAWQQVSIFLSPVDVHVNRIPIDGVVTAVVHTPGRFLPAYRHNAASENERTEIWIDHAGATVVCRQVVGLLARRIVCRVRAGQSVHTGERYGIMKFGSRIDLYFPVDARLLVGVGDRVVGGETVLAVIADEVSE
jgi:phosphatidylserine decarboxylase